MVSDRPHGPLTREDERAMRFYYVIYSIDLTRNGEFLLRDLDPNRITRRHESDGPGGEQDGLWHQTEGDEQYDYDYLADELGSSRDCEMCGGSGEGDVLQVATIEEDEVFYGLGVTTTGYAGQRTYVFESRPCSVCRGTGEGGACYRNGWHRKWVAELNHAEFLALANDRCWDLDDDERPTSVTDTMGSITEYGHLPAYAIEDHEGWTYGGEIISAQFYISEGTMPYGATSELTPTEG